MTLICIILIILAYMYYINYISYAFHDFILFLILESNTRFYLISLLEFEDFQLDIDLDIHKKQFKIISALVYNTSELIYLCWHYLKHVSLKYLLLVLNSFRGNIGSKIFI